MFKWAQQTMANVAGTKEPIYGPSAIRSVTTQATSPSTQYTESTRSDLKWQAMTTTNVESNVFYFNTDGGHIGLAQIIYSNVAGLHTTCQFNCKIVYLDGSKPNLWCSTPLKDVTFSEDKTGFYATDCAMELSEDGNTFTIKSMNDERAVVNLTVTKTAPGFVAGKDGKTLYGENLDKPWGYMRHVFWPRCSASGSVVTKDGPVDFTGRAMFNHAIQGMKPHHAAAKWDLINFQTKTYSAIIMRFTTPPSYGSTVVAVGAIAKDGELVIAGPLSSDSVQHTKVLKAGDDAWPAPTASKYTWKGTTKNGEKVEGQVEGDLNDRLDRIDVMAEVPTFVKQIVAGTVGTKPYIYQYAPTKPKLSLSLKVGSGDMVIEEGQLFAESTFISE